MISADLSTRECGGQVIVALRGVLDVADAVSAPQQQVLRVLTRTRLLDIFPVHATVAEAADRAGCSPQVAVPVL